MIESIVIWSLLTYFVFHVVSRSDLCAKPRAWAFRTLPGWLSYPITCPLCFTFHASWLASLLVFMWSGVLLVNLAMWFGAPVINMVVDLCVRVLRRADEPPLIEVKPPGPGVGVVGEASHAQPFDWAAIGREWHSPGIPHWSKPLPSPTHEGYRIRVGYNQYTADTQGKEGTVTRHFIDSDDCANDYGYQVYEANGDDGTHFRVRAEYCILLGRR